MDEGLANARNREWRKALLFEQGLIIQVENLLIIKIKRIFGKGKMPDETVCFAFGRRFAIDETRRREV